MSELKAGNRINGESLTRDAISLGLLFVIIAVVVGIVQKFSWLGLMVAGIVITIISVIIFVILRACSGSK